MTDKHENVNVFETFRRPTFERNLLSIAKGGGIIVAGKVFLAASRFAIAVLLARILGAEQYGLYSLAISAASVVTGLALLGLDSALVRFVAISAGRRDEAGLWGTLQIGLGLSTLLSVVAATGLYALAYPIAVQVFHEPRLASLLQLVSAIVPFLALSEVLAGANRGFKKMQYPVIAQFVAQPVVRLILTVALAIVGLNAGLAVIVYGLADGVASVLLVCFLHKHFSLSRPLRAARRDTRAILSYSLPDWMSGLMATFRNNIQTLFLGSLNTLTSVGIYSVAHQLTAFGGMFFSSVNTSAKPTIAELHDRGDRAQMERIYHATTRWSLTVNLPTFLLMVLLPAPILSIFGENFVSGALALAILACADLAVTGTGMSGSFLEMTGYTKLKLVNSITRLVFYLALDILLIPRWGMVGAAVAALVGELIVNLIRIIEVFVLFRMLPYDRTVLKPIGAAVMAVASVLVIGQWLPAEASPIHTAIHVLVMLGVYLGATQVFGLAAEERAMLGHLRRRASAVFSRG